MNFTLALLNLRIIDNSALIQLPQLTKPLLFSLKNSNIIKSTTNFLISDSIQRFSYSFSKSQFSNFLQTPLFITSETYTKMNEIFHSTLERHSSNLTVTNCQFINIHSSKPGAAIHLDYSRSDFTVENCVFDICRCRGKGGAIYAIMRHMTCSYNCFHLCKCGTENGNDGSTVYGFSQIGVNSQFVSCNECPRHGDQCWYGIIIFVNGRLDSRHFNMSNSDVEFISGLAHRLAATDSSTVRYYMASNQINGNSLAFIDMTFHGQHEFGTLVNNTSKTGNFYVQNSTTSLVNFLFLNNSGPITYMCVGNSKANFEKCVFSSEKVNLGIGYGQDFDCLFGQITATPLRFELFASAFCETENYVDDAKINVVDVGSIEYAKSFMGKKNQRDLMMLILVVGILLIAYVFFYRYKGRRIRIRDRNL